ncbi:MAG: sodium-translocating pyrophosphatase [Kineosporiaceae bacterium]
MHGIALAAGDTVSLSGSNTTYVAVVAAVAVVALVVGEVFRRQVLAADDGTENMKAIALAVQEGAAAFLKRQFRTLGLFVVAVFALLLLLPADDWTIRAARSGFFVVGAAFSAIIGVMGMHLAVRANVRVAAATRAAQLASGAAPGAGRDAGMRLALRTGGAVGMMTVGLGLLGAAVVVLAFKGDAPAVLEGFGFGAALLAMFMRVGGGIFTKAADVGADLVGKVEQHIPEDDARNAATIADNVGDNVGDCAGMAADLFESYAVTLVAALILGRAAFGEDGLVYPLLIPAVGAVTAALGVLLTRPKAGRDGLKVINTGFALVAGLSAVFSFLVSWFFLPSSFAELPAVTAPDGSVANDAIRALAGDPRIVAFGAVAIGIALSGVILWLTGYFTGTTTRPTRDVAGTSVTGPATVVLAGVSLGLQSAVFTAVIIAIAVYLAFALAGGTAGLALFLVALAGCGLLTTVGAIVMMDTFGPVSDNAQGIAEMSGDVDGEAAHALTELDAVGNTAKAITKGIAIATAVLAATALFGSYQSAISSTIGGLGEFAQPTGLALRAFDSQTTQPNVLIGIILGAAVVFLFAGMTINAVARAAGAVVLEVRRQFRDHPGIMDRTERPDYGRVVDICTRDSLRELAGPGLLAALSPVVVGFGLGVGPLAGFLGGAIAAGLLMAVFLANSGGAWDNAKKIVEEGAHGGKGSDAHSATIIGDTVGDPFKDTAGPSINPLIKVMNLVSVLIVPAIIHLSLGENASSLARYCIAGAALVILVAVVVLGHRDASSGDTDLDDVEDEDGEDGDGDADATQSRPEPAGV